MEEINKPEKPEIAQTDSALQSLAEQGSELPKPEKTKPEKSGKGLKIAIACCAILAVVGISFGVYGFFFKKPSSQEAFETIKDDAKLETISSVTDIKEVDAKDVVEDKEVTITNQYVKDDLNRKISLLNGISDFAKDDRTLINGAIAYNEVQNFYSRGLETTTEKATAVLTGSKNYFTTYDASWLDAYSPDPITIWIQSTYANTLDSIKQMKTYSAIPYSLANKLYYGLFNENLPKENIDTGTCGYYFTYVDSADMFINTAGFDGLGGCGGTGYSGIVVRKDSYRAKGDEAYVYTKVAMASHFSCDGSDGPYKLLNDFYSNNNVYQDGHQLDCNNVISDNVSVNGGGFLTEELDLSVLDTAADYRFVFKKNPTTGTYYFVKLEKL